MTKDKTKILSLHSACILAAMIDEATPLPEVSIYRTFETSVTDGEADAVVSGLFELGLIERASLTTVKLTDKGREAGMAFVPKTKA